MKDTYNEEQVINITMEHGYDGSEFDTKAWKQRGSLKPDRSLNALISKLETIYNHVEMQGKGKKRQYILRGKKETVSDRTFNYKGSIPTKEDKLMQEYIFNNLKKFNGISNSYNGWAKTLRFPEVNINKFDEYEGLIKDIHYSIGVPYRAAEVVSRFIQAITIRNKDVIEKSFQRLHKENRINVIEVYNTYTDDNKYEEIDDYLYEDIHTHLKTYLESKGYTFYMYSQSLTSIYKTDRDKQMIKEVEKYLIDYFGIKYFFKSYKILIVDPDYKKEVNRQDFEQAYFQRLIKLSEERQLKDNYKDTSYLWRKFYFLHTLMLMKEVGFMTDNIDTLIKNERKLYSIKSEEYSIDWTIASFEQSKKKKDELNQFNK